MLKNFVSVLCFNGNYCSTLNVVCFIANDSNTLNVVCFIANYCSILNVVCFIAYMHLCTQSSVNFTLKE